MVENYAIVFLHAVIFSIAVGWKPLLIHSWDTLYTIQGGAKVIILSKTALTFANSVLCHRDINICAVDSVKYTLTNQRAAYRLVARKIVRFDRSRLLSLEFFEATHL